MELATFWFTVASGNSVTITGLTQERLTNSIFTVLIQVLADVIASKIISLLPLLRVLLLPAPTNPVNAQYCTGDTKPAINVNSPRLRKEISGGMMQPTGGNLCPAMIREEMDVVEFLFPPQPPEHFMQRLMMERFNAQAQHEQQLH